MGSTRIVAVAQGIAVTAHRDQVDKAGLPYIEHPRRVAELVAAAGGSDEAVAAAWLHDVLEDTDLTPEDLRVAGIPEEVVAAVRAVTHRCGERLDDYAKRVAADPLAVQVKRADLADNTDPDRLGKLSAKDNDRLRAKYELMRSLLDDAAPADPAPAS